MLVQVAINESAGKRQSRREAPQDMGSPDCRGLRRAEVAAINTRMEFKLLDQSVNRLLIVPMAGSGVAVEVEMAGSLGGRSGELDRH